MFKIYDGRDSFYQWDVDRKLIVDDATITQVHFCNRTDDCSLVCETYKEGELTLVNVPNILLQDSWRINVFAYDTNYTKFSDCFNVIKRSKPEDYIYTETEVLCYSTLSKRIENIEENIGAVVEEYMENNPPQIDMTGIATEEYVQAAIEEIELTPGPQGEPGKDGYTPQKGVDYFDGKDGEPGVDGKDYVLTEADKEEIAGMVNVEGGADSFFLDFSAATSSLQPCTQDMLDFIEHFKTTDDACAYIRPASEGADSMYYPALVQSTDKNSLITLMQASINLNTISSVNSYGIYQLTYSGGAWKYYCFRNYEYQLVTTSNKKTTLSEFQTEEQVNALINTALGVIENGTY